MWFKKKDKNSFEYEVFAVRARVPALINPRSGKDSFVDVIKVKLCFSNEHLNINKISDIIEGTVKSFKPNGSNFHVLSMSKNEFEERYVRPVIVKELGELLNKKESKNEIQSILDSFNMKGSIKIEEGEYETN